MKLLADKDFGELVFRLRRATVGVFSCAWRGCHRRAGQRQSRKRSRSMATRWPAPSPSCLRGWCASGRHSTRDSRRRVGAPLQASRRSAKTTYDPGKRVAGATGLEPATSGVTVRVCPCQLLPSVAVSSPKCGGRRRAEKSRKADRLPISGGGATDCATRPCVQPYFRPTHDSRKRWG